MWRDGKWYSKDDPSLIFFAEGQKVIAKPIICLDYPEVNPSPWIPTWTLGDFGPAQKEILETTGIKNYNIQFKIEETFTFLYPKVRIISKRNTQIPI